MPINYKEGKGMYKLKKALATAGSSAVLVLSMGGVAGADAVNNCTQGFQFVGGTCVAVDDSKTVNVDRSNTVNGNCSGIFQTGDADASSTGVGGNGGTGIGVLGSGTGGAGGSGSGSSSANSGVTFDPDCSVNNVTNVTKVVAAAKAAPVEAQVVAPAGGVHAGGGAGVEASSAASIAGLAASAGSLGLGVVLRKKALLGL
jgi:hypothetical protein